VLSKSGPAASGGNIDLREVFAGKKRPVALGYVPLMALILIFVTLRDGLVTGSVSLNFSLELVAFLKH